MTNLIIDTNIIFSSLRSNNSKTRDKIYQDNLVLYAPNFLMIEIFKYKSKILNLSNTNEEETLLVLSRVIDHIKFINEASISTKSILTAYSLCKDIDEKDTPFVALSLELGYHLWTRINS